MFKERLKDLAASLDACSITEDSGLLGLDEGIISACDRIRKTGLGGGIVYIIGNGGSAGIASHFSNDLMKALRIPSVTLHDSNILTCLANDIGYEQVFSYQLDRLLKPQDLLVAISSSGKSNNILKGVDVARQRKADLITLSGFLENNPLRGQGNLNFWIDRSDYGLVESAHFFLLHSMIDLWKHATPSVPRYAQSR